jgi:hypothetical protein
VQLLRGDGYVLPTKRVPIRNVLIVQRDMSMSTAAKTRLVLKRQTAGLAGGLVSFT